LTGSRAGPAGSTNVVMPWLERFLIGFLRLRKP
jgi:hypothetical protein